MTQRDLRGFDRRRLHAVLSEATLATLRAMLQTVDEAAVGPKDAVVHRTCAVVATGRLPVRSALREAPKATLQRMCAVLEVSDRGTIDVLVDRLDRSVRYSPLGDADEVSEAIRARLPAGLEEREALLALELHARLARRTKGSTALPLGTIIGRLGRRAAAFRARAEAARDAGAFLASIGIASTPDLEAVTTSPGVDAEIDLCLRPEWADASIAVSRTEADDADPEGDGAVKELDAAHDEDALAADIAALGMGVARADDVVHPDEEALVRAYARRRAASPAITALLADLRTQVLKIEEVAKRVAARLDAPQRRSLLQHLCDVAVADGVLVDEEIDLLRRLGALLDTPVSDLEDLARRFRPAGPSNALAAYPLRSQPEGLLADSHPRHSTSAGEQASENNMALPAPSDSDNEVQPRRGAVVAEQHVDDIIALLFN